MISGNSMSCGQPGYILLKFRWYYYTQEKSWFIVCFITFQLFKVYIFTAFQSFQGFFPYDNPFSRFSRSGSCNSRFSRFSRSSRHPALVNFFINCRKFSVFSSANLTCTPPLKKSLATALSITCCFSCPYCDEVH